MLASDIEARHEACERIAREAGALARRYFDDVASIRIEMKGLQDQVSIADREVESLIKRRVAELFPNDVCLGEESGGVPGGAMWVIDPIDGTTNFLRGFPHYAVSIAFVANTDIEVGVIYDPSADDLYSARRGAGAKLNGRTIRARATEKLEEAVLCIGFSHNASIPDFISAVQQLLERGAEFRRIGSAALGLAHVAAGRFDAFWQKRLRAWDVLAGILLVREAGGRTNDFLANDGLERGNAALGATCSLYPAIAPIVGL